MKKLLAMLLAIMVTATFSACSYTPEITGVEVANSDILLMVSQDETIQYTVLTEADNEGFSAPMFSSVTPPNVDVTCESKDPAIAIVDNTG